MRFVSVFALSAFALTAMAQSYTIKGTAGAQAEGNTIYLVDQNSMAFADSCVVKDGQFKFEGTAQDQLLFEVKFGQRSRHKVYVIVEPGSNVEVDLTSQPAKVTDNGGLTDKMIAVETAVATAGNAVNAKIREMQAAGKSRDEIYAALNADIEAIYAIYQKAIDDNADNMVGAYVMGMVVNEFYPSLEKLDEAMSKVKYADKVLRIRYEREGYLKAAATQAGKMFVDFSGFSVDGAVSKLSDYVGKGKYVLVDFWASWCGPCKGEIPNLIELQNRFGGDKFMVLGVNVWDEEEKFKAAIPAEGITYPQIYIPRDNKDNATDMYGIKGIPQIILFAPDGTIVQRDLRGSAMKALVEEKMK